MQLGRRGLRGFEVGFLEVELGVGFLVVFLGRAVGLALVGVL